LTAGALQIAPVKATTISGSVTNPATPIAAQPREDFEENVAKLPDYEPGAAIAFSSASPSVNRQGLPQQWQTAPNSELPADFAPGDTVVQIWPSEPQTLTPFVSRDRYATDVYYEVLEPLVWNNLEPHTSMYQDWPDRGTSATTGWS
jgi:hypothetical protein